MDFIFYVFTGVFLDSLCIVLGTGKVGEVGVVYERCEGVGERGMIFSRR
jgi:hypothetical protein